MKEQPYYINNPSNVLPEDETSAILRNSKSLEFHQSLEDYTPTPLFSLKELAKEFNVGALYIKDESRRFGLNAFKGLGASYAIHKILEKDPGIETFCTATDGNHGRAVAWSAKMLGKQARIFVPRDTSLSRIENIELEGAVVEKLNKNYEETCEYAEIMAKGNGWTLVQDTAWEGYEEIPAQIMAGYFTHFRELEDSLHSDTRPKVDIVFLQCGVGSWPAAAAWYYQNKYKENRPKIVLVEPAEAAGMLASFHQGERTSPMGTLTTMMAGLNCGIPSLTAWEILKSSVDAAVAIEDDFMEQAIRKLYFPKGEDPKITSGESGAAGFAGFIAIMNDPRFKALKEYLNINASTRLLFFSTEGDTDPKNFHTIIEKI